MLETFPSLPRSDVEMAFPNIEVRFRLLDKLKSGVTAGRGIGAAGTIGPFALLSNPTRR